MIDELLWSHHAHKASVSIKSGRNALGKASGSEIWTQDKMTAATDNGQKDKATPDRRRDGDGGDNGDGSEDDDDGGGGDDADDGGDNQRRHL